MHNLVHYLVHYLVHHEQNYNQVELRYESITYIKHILTQIAVGLSTYHLLIKHAYCWSVHYPHHLMDVIVKLL